ncbi:MAG: 2-hydroxyacyl-CoA dehydratase family protein [Dehalococcoidia bacterium]
MTQIKRYKSERLACWQQAKELRNKHYRDIWEAKEKGKVLATGGEYSFIPLVAGLGDYEFLGGEPYGATVGTDQNLATECAEAAEARGFARDMCSYMRLYWGSMFLDKSPWGKFVKPDFCLSWHLCESHGKWYQLVSEHMGIPSFVIEIPLGPRTQNRREAQIRYLVAQMEEAIDWMQKVTGRGYDDGLLIEAVSNEIDATAIWAKCCELNKNIPAPLDLKSMFSLYVISSLIRCQPEAADFFRTLYDEVKYRVDNQIAALATERCRLYHDAEPVWHFLQLFRIAEKYGAVVPASFYAFVVGTAFEADENGHWLPAKTMAERGAPLKNRGEALELLATSYVDRPGLWGWMPQQKVTDSLSIYRDWQCDGAILHLNRGCEGLTQGLTEAALALKAAGAPTMVYESNMVDPREFSPTQVVDSLESFLESLGLTKLDD